MYAIRSYYARNMRYAIFYQAAIIFRRFVMLIVITSYSIHYTKLYDEIVNVTQDGKMFMLFVGDFK